ncbi:hypothetical protein D3C71_1721690 [compost metagenome]
MKVPWRHGSLKVNGPFIISELLFVCQATTVPVFVLGVLHGGCIRIDVNGTFCVFRGSDRCRRRWRWVGAGAGAAACVASVQSGHGVRDEQAGGPRG